MNEEIKILINKLDNEDWLHFMEDGVPYKLLFMEERDLLLNYISNLQNRIDKATKLLKEKVKIIPFDENGEGGGLELTDYDIQDLLDILKESGE